jgi:hypothetical protein
MGKEEKCRKGMVGKPEEAIWKTWGVDMRIILKCLLKKLDVSVESDRSGSGHEPVAVIVNSIKILCIS